MPTKLKPRHSPGMLPGLTIREFLAFTDTRPDGERWELIEGEPVLSAPPTIRHQIIATNIAVSLGNINRTLEASWIPIFGIGIRIPASPNSLPQPDVMVFGHPMGRGSSQVTDDAFVVIDVVAPTDRHLRWKTAAYRSVATCQYHVTIAERQVEVIRHDRANNWEPVVLNNLDAALALPALGAAVSIPLATIYESTPLSR